MFSVALIGPDGAGKTTIGRRLEQTLPLKVKYLYMGVNLEASNRMLPTTRLVRGLKRALGAKPDAGGPPDPGRRPPPPRNPFRRAARGLKSLLGLTQRASEEWYRQALAWYFQRSGHVVVFDRHYFHDFFAYDVAAGPGQKSLARRIHGYMLARLYPKPDLVIYLDAPGEVLLARKGEGTLESLERRRREYRELGRLVEHFAVVDASQPLEQAAADVARCILDFHASRSGKGVEDHDRPALV